MKVAHGVVEEFRLFVGERVNDVFNRNVILVTATRFAERVLKNALAAVAELIFVCSEVYHFFSSVKNVKRAMRPMPLRHENDTCLANVSRQEVARIALDN